MEELGVDHGRVLRPIQVLMLVVLVFRFKVTRVTLYSDYKVQACMEEGAAEGLAIRELAPIRVSSFSRSFLQPAAAAAVEVLGSDQVAAGLTRDIRGLAVKREATTLAELEVAVTDHQTEPRVETMAKPVSRLDLPEHLQVKTWVGDGRDIGSIKDYNTRIYNGN